MSRRTTLALALVLLVASAAAADAQDRVDRGGGSVPKPPRESAPVDLAGTWVAFVTEDWRYRMTTPARGDYSGVPLNAEGRKLADAWNPEADARAGLECRPFGAGGIMRVPGRLRIAWQDDYTLRVDTDAGQQTRRFDFKPPISLGIPTWQGRSAATWNPASRSLTVVTTRLRGGYLRRNGVPYSENAVVTEHFDVAPHPGGNALLIVTTIVDDARYLLRPFVVSSHFKKETDDSKWNPTPCSAPW